MKSCRIGSSAPRRLAPPQGQAIGSRRILRYPQPSLRYLSLLSPLRAALLPPVTSLLSPMLPSFRRRIGHRDRGASGALCPHVGLVPKACDPSLGDGRNPSDPVWKSAAPFAAFPPDASPIPHHKPGGQDDSIASHPLGHIPTNTTPPRTSACEPECRRSRCLRRSPLRGRSPRAKIPDFKVCAVRVAKTEPPAGRDPATDLPLIGRGAIKDQAGLVH